MNKHGDDTTDKDQSNLTLKFQLQEQGITSTHSCINSTGVFLCIYRESKKMIKVQFRTTSGDLFERMIVDDPNEFNVVIAEIEAEGYEVISVLWGKDDE